MENKHNFIGFTGDQVGTDKDPVAYKGFLIYERYLREYGNYYGWNSMGQRQRDCVGGWIWAVVKDGKEVSQLAGPNGARKAIDDHLSGENKFTKMGEA